MNLQEKLINRADIALYIQISKSVNEDKLNEMIIKAQFNELLPLMGERLYNNVIENPNDYTDLLNGHIYTFQGITYTNYGLKAVLAHYTDAYYKMFGDATDTPFGLVNKLNGNESKPVESGMKKSMFTMNKQVAFNLWVSVEKFLVRTNNQLFLNNKCQTRQKFNFSKITR